MKHVQELNEFMFAPGLGGTVVDIGKDTLNHVAQVNKILGTDIQIPKRGNLLDYYAKFQLAWSKWRRETWHKPQWCKDEAFMKNDKYEQEVVDSLLDLFKQDLNQAPK